jgi:hypothetical protein
VTTCSFKRGTIWWIDFKNKEDFHQKVWAVSPFGDFLPPKKKPAQNWLTPLVVPSHTSTTSSICIIQNSELHCFWYNPSDQMDWCNTFMFANEWLSGTEVLVYICERTELKKATEQALPIPGAVSLPQIFIKMHIPQQGPHPVCYTDSDV